ncbi:MAG: hypothetical protein Q9228_003644 [Teloschistes exilis]
MLLWLDLWGRGYSDSPLGVTHDATLFGNQIFYALTSSPISRTGQQSGGLSVVAFSLGGRIAVSLAAHYPCLINSIVLLAPGGLLRALPTGYGNPLYQFPRLVPTGYLRKLVANIIGVRVSADSGEVPVIGVDVMKKAPLDAAAITQWQFDHHKGFVYSFIDTVVHGPLMNQHADWKKLCDIIRGPSIGAVPTGQPSRRFDSKILVIFGDEDGLVVKEEVSADLLQMLGDPKHVDIRVVTGGHGFPMPSSDDVVKHIGIFMNLT